MARTVYFDKSFKFSKTHPTPSHIGFDTSFIIEVFFSSAKSRISTRASICRRFFEEVNRNKIKKCITTQIILEVFDRIISSEIIDFLELRDIPPRLANNIWRQYFKYIKNVKSKDLNIKKEFKMSIVLRHIGKFMRWLLGKNKFLIIPSIPKYVTFDDIKAIIEAAPEIVAQNYIAKTKAEDIDINEAMVKLQKETLSKIAEIFENKETSIKRYRNELAIISSYVDHFKLQAADAKIIHEYLNNNHVKVSHLVSLDKDFLNASKLKFLYFPAQIEH